MKQLAAHMLMLLAIAAAVTYESPGQDIRLHVPSDSVAAGEPFELSVVARYPNHLSLQIPHAEGDDPPRLGDFVLITLEARDRSVAGNQVTDSLVFQAAAFRLERASSLGGSVSFRSRDTVVEFDVPVVEIGVRSTVGPDATPRDLSPILRAPPPLWWFILPLVIGLMLFLGIRRFRRRSRPRSQAERALLPPLEEALAALSDLGSDGSPQEHDRAFVILVSDILRTFIGRRLGLRARESTTGELLRDIALHPAVTASMTDALRPLMNTMDAVKFARKPLPCSRDDLRKRVRQWIVEIDRLASGRQAEALHVTPTSEP